jgi:Circadian oscillating protein COP23
MIQASKSLLSLAAIGAIAFATTPAFGESDLSSETTFFCQTDNNIPTTLAKTSNGRVLPIFHWKADALPPQTDLQQTCNSVSEKLENYLVSEEDLAAVSFKSTKLDNIPAICLAGENKDCNLVLVTLLPVDKPIETANEVLESILDPQLQANKAIYNDRGIQSTAYSIDFWQLLGLGF